MAEVERGLGAGLGSRNLEGLAPGQAAFSCPVARGSLSFAREIGFPCS